MPSLDDLKAAGASNAVLGSLKKDYFAGLFAIKGMDNVGAVVGSDLRRRATLAVGLSFLGMLVYVGFRFKPIYGAAGVVALIHDVVITLGLFALTQKEISLTVIAALLTLVGYSMNDTIVIFDRVRENLRTHAEGVPVSGPQSEHKSDAFPDHHDFRHDLSFCFFPFHFRWRSAEWFFVCVDDRNHYRHLFFHWDSVSNRGMVVPWCGTEIEAEACVN